MSPQPNPLGYALVYVLATVFLASLVRYASSGNQGLFLVVAAVHAAVLFALVNRLIKEWFEHYGLDKSDERTT